MLQAISREELTERIRKLASASERRQMSMISDHAWNSPKLERCWLRRKENLSIYGTEYFDLATEDELYKLSRLELATWWQGFMIFERLVTEYYMGLVNQSVFASRPEIEEYLHHFCREEVNHAMVFAKAMDWYNVPLFEVPEFLTDFYNDTSYSGKYPLMTIYLTLVMEWIADRYQKNDVASDDIDPLAKSVVREHAREEARHIDWAKYMVLNLATEVPEFEAEVKQFTAPFCRQFLQQGVTNIEAYERVDFKHPRLREHEEVLAAVIDSENTQRIHREIMEPLLDYFVKAGIYDVEFHESWVSAGFEKEIEASKARVGKKRWGARSALAAELAVAGVVA